MAEQIKVVLIKFYCLNKIMPKLGKPQVYSLFTASYGLYPMYLQTTGRITAIQSYTETKIFGGPMYDMKHMQQFGERDQNRGTYEFDV
jgi:hypothetical protein